jgi:hypothetical protein
MKEQPLVSVVIPTRDRPERVIAGDIPARRELSGGTLQPLAFPEPSWAKALLDPAHDTTTQKLRSAEFTPQRMTEAYMAFLAEVP